MDLRRPWMILLLLAAACHKQSGSPPVAADSNPADPATSINGAAPAAVAATTPAPAPPASKGPPSWLTDPGPPPPKPPVNAADADVVQIEVFSETGYPDPRGRYVLDLMERDYGYLTAELHTPEGNPVRGARLQISATATHGSRVVMPDGAAGLTNDQGQVDFGIIAGKMGLDDISLRFADARFSIQVNVVSLAAAGVPSFDDLKDVVPWDKLMRARISYSNHRLNAQFLPEIAALNGKTVKLAGFMFPLETESNQKHFLLTANPPSCFFHIPGGPAGSVEIFATRGIPAGFDPMILEGKLETRRASDNGVIYRLVQARATGEPIQ